MTFKNGYLIRKLTDEEMEALESKKPWAALNKAYELIGNNCSMIELPMLVPVQMIIDEEGKLKENYNNEIATMLFNVMGLRGDITGNTIILPQGTWE